MIAWTVQCSYAAYYANTVTVEADTLDDALDKAIIAANEDASWKSLDYCGPIFIDAVAEGADADPWRDHVSAIQIPERFTERGAAIPLITVIVVGGVVQDVTFENGPARVIVRDYDTEGADPAEIDTDENGERYVRGDWNTKFRIPADKRAILAQPGSPAIPESLSDGAGPSRVAPRSRPP